MLQRGISSSSSKSDFLAKIITQNLIKSAEYVLDHLEQEERDKLQLELPSQHGPMSLLFNLSHEDIIVKIMKTLEPSQWKMVSRNGLNENLLHYFIKQKMSKAINQMLSFTRDGMEDLLFQTDAAGNFPIMTILRQNFEGIAEKLWKQMIETNEKINKTNSGQEIDRDLKNQNIELKRQQTKDMEKLNSCVTEISKLPSFNDVGVEDIILHLRQLTTKTTHTGEIENNTKLEDDGNNHMDGKEDCIYKTKRKFIIRTLLEDLLTHKNKKQNTLLHLCAEFKQNSMLELICRTKEIPKKAIQQALTEKNPDGKSVLVLIKDQDSMINILSRLEITEMNIFKDLDKKGRNIFHHLVIKDFVKVIMLLKNFVGRQEFLELILHPGLSHQNNVLMRAALGSATQSLQFLLCLISTEELSTEEADRILHSKDSFGNNLLSLVLQQGESLKVSKQILLELEKKFHDKVKHQPWESFITCMKNNIKPSKAVLEAIRDVEKTLPKSKFNTTLIIGKSFIQHFLLPSTVIAVDIAFDILLIKEYYSMDQEYLDDQYMNCLLKNTPTSVPNCNITYSSPAYECIPLKFTRTPR